MKEMREKLKTLLALIIDERNMLESKVIAAAERNLRECAFGGKNTSEVWGGLPVVILFGDDYQLPPIMKQGAINGFAQKKKKGITKETKELKDGQLFLHRGNAIFTDLMTEHVFHLTKNMRVSDELKHFKSLLLRLRTGDPTNEDAQDLCKLDLANYPEQFRQQLDNHPKTVWLYAENKPKDKKNYERLRKTSKSFNVPVARLNCYYESESSGNSEHCIPNRNHFYQQHYVRHTDICLHSTVAISDVNFIPEIGLYYGARGKVVEMIFKKPEGPNDKQRNHLPEYVVVDFPNLSLPSEYEPWDKNHPTVSHSISTNMELFTFISANQQK